MQLTRNYKRGDKLTAEDMNSMVNAVLSVISGGGAGVRSRFDGKRFMLALDETRVRQIAGGGGTIMPFKMSVGKQTDDPTKYAVKILDGKVNNEWPDVGTDAMGETGSRTLNIVNIENCNVFIRVMFNARTNNQERLDIYERPNETYPTNKITWLDPATAITPDACDAVDNPDDPPPPGYGAFHVMLGFTYLKPPPTGSPPGTPSSPKVFNLVLGHVNYALFYGADDGIPSVLPVATYSKWTKIPQQPPPP